MISLAALFLFGWFFFKSVGLAFRVAWCAAKVVAAVLFVVALPLIDVYKRQGLIVLLINWQFSGFISLSRSAVLHGQIWRLITFLFQPVWLGGALGILNLVFYFWIGNSLTRAWGDFRMTLFIALGVLGAWISCFLAGGASPDGIFLSCLLYTYRCV